MAALHACWDASYGCAIRIGEGLGGEGWQIGWPDTAAGVGTPTGTDLLRFQVVYAVLQWDPLPDRPRLGDPPLAPATESIAGPKPTRGRFVLVAHQ